ncbi:cation diffusion facilitator family transporter [Clostridium paraputrificum]|uniref:cation diffusion facilitator family transporter n=1 Tax=Clostridium TaxID=1485 RepID=UPI00189CA7EE|nr:MULTISPECIES: cation diffusion facilitator family transporter [Clostridium]MBS7130140.1 cation transporter [Clostridium sp.]MDB2074110.1 cation diffusion facilitator family transporter [Clostridium paraputrificum]MDB2078036.1 cation diffusion facilitator family transporter [Clostridium paraputrificum]MDB2093177.1 cation diffusion facilitator family transporter [Clostridium paraputrificum]MDB2097962.1 cation diffusion facilitator family transporter [Clostridium paraputrificum]
MKDERLEIGVRVSKNTIIGNFILAFIKILIGFIARSTAMLADGMHSLSDVVTTIGVIIGLKLSHKEADKSHPYGHERIESITSLFLSTVLFLVAISIGYSGIIKIINHNYVTPGFSAIIAAITSIIVKELMYWYTIKYANEINSPSLKADAWHHRSDALSSIGALIGIAGARMGYPFLDPLVAIIIALVIIKVAFDICKQSIAQLIDEAASEDDVQVIIDKINSIDGIYEIKNLKTRQHSNRLYVDVDISVDATLTVEEGHNIASYVHNLIEEDSRIKHCMVHVNPYYKNI